MKDTAFSKRSGAVLFFNKVSPAFVLTYFIFLASCVAPSGINRGSGSLEVGDRSDAAVADSVEAGSATDSSNTVALVESETAAAQPEALSSSRILAPAANGVLGLELVDGELSDPSLGTKGGFNKLVIQTGSDNVQYKVSKLSSPPRLVLDVLNYPTRVGRSFETEDAELVQRIRLGAHPDKSRIVLDLREDPSIRHEVTKDAGDLVVTLAHDNLIELASSRASFKSEASGADVVETADAVEADQALHAAPEIRLPLGDSNVEEDQNVKNQEESVDLGVGLGMGSAGPVVTGLSLETMGAGVNSLVAEISSAGFFTLQRTAPSEYVLKLEGATLDPIATGTLIAPQGSGNIRSVRPVVQGGDVILRIFASPDAALSADAKNGKIVVTDGQMADFMAQAKAEGAEASTDKKAEGEAAQVKAESSDDKYRDEIAKALDVGEPKYVGRLISLDLQDTDIDNALRIIAEVSNLNIIASDEVAGKVTLRLIDVPWDQALEVILRTNGLDKVQEGNVIRIAPVEKLRLERENLADAMKAEEESKALLVKYIRVSYARASELKPLVEGVLSERGSVAYDERTNQLIIKDIDTGVNNVAELVSKLDLRTPQVLLETQILEAERTFLRDIGVELGFQYLETPATGNATGNNFPNSIAVAGSASPNPDSIVGANFPAALGLNSGSAASFLFGSADGTQTLQARISALEQEGKIRIISRPAVATTNNREAIIKSIEKIRVKTPSGGLSVATGAGANAGGGSAIATEVIEIGIILEVIPQASPDYYVLLDINAKSSTIGGREVEGIPSEIERSATSTVIVSSGQTFAMGGIYKTTDNNGVTGMPFFKDIPVIGALFRRSKVEVKDEELLFFITPRIVEGSFDDAAMRVAS